MPGISPLNSTHHTEPAAHRRRTPEVFCNNNIIKSIRNY